MPFSTYSTENSRLHKWLVAGKLAAHGVHFVKGKTPAEACEITIEGKNKWMTLIQNASGN